jgi:hypothetical protein
MKRIIAATLMTVFMIAPAMADRDWHRHRDRGINSSRVLDAMVTLSLLGMLQQSTQYDPYARSLKDPYRQPYVQGDPYPPQRPLK